jgi:hypothetical protein
MDGRGWVCEGVGVQVLRDSSATVTLLTHSLIVNMYVISLINHNSYSKNNIFSTSKFIRNH